MPHILNYVNVIVNTTFGTFSERVENSISGIGHWLHDIQDVTHGDATPLSNTGPPLNAEVLGDLLLLRHCLELGVGELARIRNQPADT